LLAVALALRRAPALVRATGFVSPAASAPPREPASPGATTESGPAAVAPMVERPGEPPPAEPEPAGSVPLRATPAARAVPVPRPPEPERPPGGAAAPQSRAPDVPLPPRAQSPPDVVEPAVRRAPDAAVVAHASVAAAVAPGERAPETRSRPRRPLVRPVPTPPDRAALPAVIAARPTAPVRVVEAAPPAAPVAGEPLARRADTELGGLFYLLNLALFLGLYGDFTRPREPGIALSPWDLVALLGEALLGERPSDPVWSTLAELTGEPQDFRAPTAWRVPREWLEPLDADGAWRWSAAAGVLRVLHPAGFPVVAVPRTGAPTAAQLRRELRRLRCRVEPVRTALAREPAGAVERWIARLAAYCRARLRVALGSDDVAGILLRRHARVFVTSTHVDVVFSLAEHPIEIRFAGLDRTPGFIPATGRVVALHFE
jgi:hypothetical protein